jgi:acyl-CoA synthetase (AMP-forming)/AMP-acid ligase II
VTTATGFLSARIAAVVEVDPDAPAVEHERRWSTWGELGAFTAAVAAAVAPAEQVGVILRNRPAHVGALLGVLRAEACVVTINPGRGVERTREDIRSLGLDTIVGTADDLDELVGDTVRRQVAIAALDERPVVRVDDAVSRGAAEPRPGVAVRMLTSGTTGPPKRVELTEVTLARVLVDAKHYEKDKATDVRLRRGVTIVNSPLVHLGGLFRVLTSVSDGRSFCLLPKFSVDGWADAVRRHQPRTASLVPTALRMVLEADLDPADLASIKSVICGTAPLGPDEADAFTARYGIPVLVTYAATEFGGSVAGWTLADHADWWTRKRGSVGRAHPGCQLRVVGETTGTEVGVDEPGLLEVLAAQLGSGEWVRTTDLVRIDADGFVWILGRADQAIIRGGFKVLPDDVRRGLERHPAVREAVVLGRLDARLGAVPVAAVELTTGASATADDILEHAKAHLSPYEVPVELRVVDALPRTAVGKVDQVELGELLGTGA